MDRRLQGCRLVERHGVRVVSEILVPQQMICYEATLISRDLQTHVSLGPFASSDAAAAATRSQLMAQWLKFNRGVVHTGTQSKWGSWEIREISLREPSRDARPVDASNDSGVWMDPAWFVIPPMTPPLHYEFEDRRGF